VRAVALIGAGLAALSAVMILIVSQVEDGLIDAWVQTLLIQGEIIAWLLPAKGRSPTRSTSTSRQPAAGGTAGAAVDHADQCACTHL
jgi:hypothetical protein